MLRYRVILFVLLFSSIGVRADLTMEQQISDTNHVRKVTIKIHDDKMRMDQPGESFSVIVDLKTHDSYTLLNSLKKYLFRFGSEVRWEMKEERKHTNGTNEMDFPPAPAVDTGKSETVDGYDSKIYTWNGAHGLVETMWVAAKYPNLEQIRPELVKLDQFNDTGQHRNAQPFLAPLPGMVLKTVSELHGFRATNVLVSATLGPLDDSLFKIPPDYKMWERNKAPNHETNSPAGH